MPYYPVAMGYPDYSMYQPYQYYAMPTGQFQNPLAYIPMNGMPNGAGGGYVPNRKKHFKSHHNNNNNTGYHHNNGSNSGYYHNNHTNNNSHTPVNANHAGGLHHPYSKHSSASTHSLSGSTKAGEGVETRGAELNNTELVPRIDNPANPTTTEITESPVSTGTTPLAEPVAEPVKDEKPPVQEDDSPAETDLPEPIVSSAKEETQIHPEEKAQDIAPEDDKKISAPLFFNITLDELIESKRSVLELAQKALELKLNHIKEVIEAEPSKDFLVDTKRSFHIIDHDNGSDYRKQLGSGLPKPASQTNDNETNDSTAPKPALNWASLLQSTAKKTKKVKAQAPTNGEPASKQLAPFVSAVPTLSDRYQSLGLLVMSMLYDPSFNLSSFAPFKLNPRGLTNTGNICYMNAVLQCLIFCEPFSRILRLVEEKSLGLLGKTSLTPVLDATINFMNDFSTVNSTNKSAGGSFNSDGIVVGRPLSPENLYMKLVECPKFQHLKWGQQEDAEEFLVYLLDGLHEDFVKAEAAVTAEQMEQLSFLYSQNLDSTRALDLKARMKHAARLVKNTDNKATEELEETEDENSETGWSEVGGRRKVSSKRVSEVEPSPITKIFGGRFRSVLTVPKSKDSHSITVDPYRSILLDISLEEVNTIEDALWKLNEVEKLPYKTEDGVEVVAQKQTYIEDLPEVLTLQLKRFSFQHKQEEAFENGSASGESGVSLFHGVGTIEKVLKNVSYGLELTVPLESLSPAARNVQNRKYVLTGVIYHHGRNAEGGHYTCDVLRGDNKWLRIDDTAVELIDATAVTEMPDAKDKSAYIFIYQRNPSAGL